MSEAKKGFMKLFAIIILVLLIVFVKINVVDIMSISGNSMHPYISNNGVCIVTKKPKNINRYDVIIAIEDKKTIIKRIIACPNDRVQIVDNHIYVNGKMIEQYNYETERGGIAENEIVLSENEYFVVGDNRKISYDSRDFGSVNIDNIKGKIIYVLWKGIGE